MSSAECSRQRSLNWCIMTHIWLSIAAQQQQRRPLHSISFASAHKLRHLKCITAMAVCFLKRAVTIIRNRMDCSWSVAALEEVGGDGFAGLWWDDESSVETLLTIVDEISSLMLSLRFCNLHVCASHAPLDDFEDDRKNSWRTRGTIFQVIRHVFSVCAASRATAIEAWSKSNLSDINSARCLKFTGRNFSSYNRNVIKANTYLFRHEQVEAPPLLPAQRPNNWL